ncbi:DUF2270 domain-containing protein [Natrinema ejinorense]|uniref:DUF2270 domain-containing protein n=1 Tax=Natrinema ejinorense TaxID=373386 RepID=A0A2A5QTC8_9EURY|nr:DUF2270 domain-containing protein [Natrinema ejinorense]PCR90055.1 hypothetical protein CP557_05570 [Natrinema ejinorense]
MVDESDDREPTDRGRRDGPLEGDSGDDRADRDGPLDRGDQEIGATVAGDTDSLLGVLPHFYRGEVSQATNAQDRIDRTTDWAITLLAAVLSLVFSSRNMPAFLLLIGMFVLSIFLFFEVRRYRFYDHWRARVRFVQENVFANALEPTGVEHPAWREELSDDLRHPTFKVSNREALSRRIRRVYGLLFSVAVVGWVFKVTLFTPEQRWTEAAELPGVPGTLVAVLLGVFFGSILALGVWPSRRQAKGEINGQEPGKWKND